MAGERAVKLDLERVATQRNDVAYLHYRPRKTRVAAIVAAHGYSSSKQNLDPLCGFLCAHGYEIFSLDFPGHKLGASGGRLRDFDDCLDAMAAVIGVARTSCGDPYLLGHSLGALTALVSAGRDREARGVVSIATGYRRPAALEALQRTFTSDLRAEYVDGASLPELFAHVDALLDDALPLLAGRPALFVGADHDAMVTPSSVRELYDRAPEPKRFASIASNHTNAGEHARTVVLQWLKDVAPV
jgi:pimeloyl-ACP methyl ester carboxylesterase